MSNAVQAFRAAMTAASIDYAGEIYPDGKLHRFKAEGDGARNSWYVLHDGSSGAGAFGCWKRGFTKTWCEHNGPLSHVQSIEVRRCWQEAAREHDRVKGERQKKARQTATWILARAKPITTHGYLNAKQVRSHGDLREYRGRLALPLADINGELHSLQFIGTDGSKKFLGGGRVAGCFFTLADKADVPLVICEGYATGASIHEATGHAVICAMNSGNLLDVAKAVRELWPQREIVIAADNDQFTDGNPGLTKATAAAKSIGAKLAVPQFKDTASKLTDFNDLAIAESLALVREQIESADVPAETDADTFKRLAGLSAADYDRCRQTEAVALGIRVTTLDNEVERLRPWTGGNDSTLQGGAIDLLDVEPWPEPVNGAEVLDEISNAVSHYVGLPPGAADVTSLWVTHSHCFDAFDITPRLNVTSPEKGCGKTTLLDVIALFVPRPLRTENLTAAVLFRLIESRKPTVLADEYDSWLRDKNEELRGLFNAGHRRGGQALRCEGESHEVRAFRVFGPAVLAGIGALPGTLHDRSIQIRLERAKRGEALQRFDSRRTERENELCRKVARWCRDNRARLEACDPKMPERAFNRVADNWRPLFAIAAIAGGDWPKRCADAFEKLTRNDADTDGIRILLLTDIRQVFTRERMFSKDLIEQLAEMSERPWPDVCRGRPITERWLARNLAAFRIHSKTLRIGDDRAKGYERADFSEAFERYLLPEKEEFIRDSVTYEEKDEFGPVTDASDVTDRKAASTEGMSRCHACTGGLSENEGAKSPDKQAELLIDGLGVARL